MAARPSEPVVIFETVHGSTAFGLSREGSDVDLKGVVIGPSHWYFGLKVGPEQLELSPDHVRFELRKFLRLATDANPTMIEMLWADPIHHRTVTDAGRRILAIRDEFLTKTIADRFGGYALSQLKRIRTHRGWLLDPPKAPPTRAQFGLPERTVIPADQLAAAEVLLSEGDQVGADVSPNFIDLLARERRYKSSQNHWASYRQWQQHRNPKRTELETRFGYDTKHAMHLVRLQRMALEMLTNGEVHVSRPDRVELLAIRDGAWTFERLEEEAERVDSEIRQAAQRSSLPSSARGDRVEALAMDLIEEYLHASR